MDQSFPATTLGVMLIVAGVAGAISLFRSTRDDSARYVWLFVCAILILAGFFFLNYYGWSVHGAAVATAFLGLLLGVFMLMNNRWLSFVGFFILLVAVAVFVVSPSAGYQ